MKQKILVVEDEIIIAHDIKGILNDDYEVIINIKTVEEAIEKIETEKPDLVLLDINLKSEKNGISVGEYLLNKNTIPFIYITSYYDASTLDSVKETRPYGFIVKPFKTTDLLTSVFLALNTFKYRKIDLLRADEEFADDIPFRIKETINYINEHLYEKIELDDLVKITNWKKHHFIRVFTKYIGVTPYQYILSRKIEKAKVLLFDETLQISSIAFELGFQSYSNFVNAFKKLTSITPEAYRNKARLKNKIQNNG